MPDGNFWTGIAEGYLKSKRESELQARDEEMQTKRQYFDLMSGMLDKVAPESQPLIFKAMGDVLGMKGKERGIWDFISGAGMQGAKQKVEQRYSDMMDRAISPLEASQMRAGAGLAGLAQKGVSPENMTPEQKAIQSKIDATNQRLKESIIWRDPRQEKMEDFERQKQLLNQQNVALKQMEAEHKMELERERIRGKADIEKQKFMQNVSQELTTTAMRLAAMPEDKGGMGAAFDMGSIPPDVYIAKAADHLFVRDALEGKYLEGKMKALTGEGGTVFYNPQTGSISTEQTVGALSIKPSQAAVFANQKLSDFRQQGLSKERMGLQLANDLPQAKAKLEGAKSKLQGLMTNAQKIASAKGIRIDVDPNGSPVLIDSSGKILPNDLPTMFSAGITRDMQKQFLDLQREISQAQSEVDGITYASQQLGAPGRLVQPTAPTAPTPKAKPAAKAKPSAPTANVFQLSADKVDPTAKVGDKINSKDGKTFQIRGIKTLPNGEKKYVIQLVQ